MPFRPHATSLPLTAVLAAALVAFAAVADNEADCAAGGGDESFSAAGHGNDAPPTAPPDSCAERPCRTPVRVTPEAPRVQALGTVTTLVLAPMQAPIEAEAAAPPTPPPVALR